MEGPNAVRDRFLLLKIEVVDNGYLIHCYGVKDGHGFTPDRIYVAQSREEVASVVAARVVLAGKDRAA